MRGAPSQRGAPAQRGAPVSATGGRGVAPVSRGLPARAAPAARGSPSVARGRGMQPVSVASRPQPVVQEYDDYGVGAGYEEPVCKFDTLSLLVKVTAKNPNCLA